ncbi:MULTISPECIES: hypothetical protein [unclassified Pseudomonas]|uniref:hypothetical protein n=1 Tax=unclassified Pseudomonas TaxID=196821 RepID=UPI000C88DE70|nr:MULTISPECIES: hypothetical protein [unclassified Pseudomonas]PNA93640.1 hypothetical protein C1X74_21020 [Pseudomonas sp. GW460-5]PNB56160.1 hypothetical protein C1X73_20050 [Pseudomonas sp. FW305-130]
MSLESSVADLVTVGKDLISVYEGKINAINAAVTKAIAAVPRFDKKLYVNQVTGDDTAAGTADAPLKTIAMALTITPQGGFCDVVLQADYTMTQAIAVLGRVLNIYSDQTGVKRKLKPIYYLTTNGAANYLAGFLFYSGGVVMLGDVTLELPTANGVVPAPAGTRNSFFTSNTSGGSDEIRAKLSSCDVVAPAGFTGWLAGAAASSISLQVTAVTFPENFAGRYIYGVAGGTNPATLPNVLTNLPSL